MKGKKSILFALSLILISYAGCRKIETPAVIADIEGNTYKTVKIGNQEWMAENLKTTKFSDGTDIPLMKDASAWSSLTAPAFCWYDNDETTYKDSFGALYNGYTVETGQLCPSGWHVPSREEWQQLREYLGDTVKAGGKLKEAGLDYWLSPNKGADNSSGFSALPAGFRYFEGSFSSILSYTAFWSESDSMNDGAWFAGLYYANASLAIEHRNKKHGFSVRCIKN